ncbi:MAG TPA: hypothetical protein VL201_00440, partial [Patescibacteria group bacterium]|nr:hypothetical protein [Patescibacteria group bacterium]
FFNINNNLNKIYTLCIANKIYVYRTQTVYAASSLQTISPVIIGGGNDQIDTLYTENPLPNKIIQSHSLIESSNTILYRGMVMNIQKPMFFFNKIYDGPNARDVWLIGCCHYKRNRSSILIKQKTNSSSNVADLIRSQHFSGIIKNLILHRDINRGHFLIEHNEIKILYEIMIDEEKHEVSYASFEIDKELSFFKKLYILSNRLLIALTTNTLYKIDLDKQKIDPISVLDYENKNIILLNIIQNVSLPYLWLLLSKTNELYFLNLKDQREKVYFSKVLDLPASDNIWFDLDHILVKHTEITLPLPDKQPSTVPVQYSLYELRILLAKANVLRLFQDNNNAK